jgi:hypothetical protein
MNAKVSIANRLPADAGLMLLLSLSGNTRGAVDARCCA